MLELVWSQLSNRPNGQGEMRAQMTYSCISVVLATRSIRVVALWLLRMIHSYYLKQRHGYEAIPLGLCSTHCIAECH